MDDFKEEREALEVKLILQRLAELNAELEPHRSENCGGWDCYDCYRIDAVNYILTGKRPS